MSRFIPNDLPEFEEPIAIAHHEAAHAVLAYLFGFRMGPFRTFKIPNSITSGSLETQPNKKLADNLTRATTERVKQLLAGEIAARIVTRSPIDEVVMPVPLASRVNNRTSLELLNRTLSSSISTDIVRVLDYMGFIEIVDWWPWFWDRHEETRDIVQANWKVIQSLAVPIEEALRQPNLCKGSQWLVLFRFVPVFMRPSYWAPGTSIITAKWIIDHLEGLGVDPMDTDF